MRCSFLYITSECADRDKLGDKRHLKYTLAFFHVGLKINSDLFKKSLFFLWYFHELFAVYGDINCPRTLFSFQRSFFETCLS